MISTPPIEHRRMVQPVRRRAGPDRTPSPSYDAPYQTSQAGARDPTEIAKLPPPAIFAYATLGWRRRNGGRHCVQPERRRRGSLRRVLHAADRGREASSSPAPPLPKWLNVLRAYWSRPGSGAFPKWFGAVSHARWTAASPFAALADSCPYRVA